MLECLAHGWVDSLTRGKDGSRPMLRISPRKAGSNWSRVNKAPGAAFAAQGPMTPAGCAAIERAKADGTWDALDGVEALEVPPTSPSRSGTCARPGTAGPAPSGAARPKGC